MQFLYSAAFALSTFVGALFGAQVLPQEQPLGAALPAATAVFETSLAAPITSSATSLTLSANAVRGGGSLSGFNCFTIDEGSAQAEFVCGTVSATSVASLTRGISPLTGTTTDSDLQFAHRRGANVKITDFPLLQILKAQANGEDTYPNPLSYDSGVTLTQDSQLATKKYVDDTAFSGASVINASDTARGIVERATQIEAASSSASGSTGALLFLGANIATSTYNSATAALRVLMTGNDGFISSNFLPNTITKALSFSNSVSLSGASATTNIASSSISVFSASTTPSTTWTKKANLRYVVIEVQGAGGSTPNASGVGGGAGAGGYGKKIIPAAALGSTEAIVVGGPSGAGPNIGGPSSFGSHCSATGGSAGGSSDDQASAGGAGGVGSQCDLNIRGGAGTAGQVDERDGSNVESRIGGNGGSGVLGGGGAGGAASSGAATANGSAGGSYGGGAGGAANGNGAAGASGVVVVTEVFF